MVRKNGVKAVLSGEGSDECYLGYEFLVPESRKNSNSLKGALYKFIQLIVKRMGLPAEGTINSSEFVMGFSPYSSVANMSAPQRRLKLAEIVTGLHNRFEVAVETESIRTGVLDGDTQNEYSNYMKSIDLLNYNLRALLHRNDSMGMAASIESRFPFLDSRLVNMAVNMPYDCKIRSSSIGLNGNRSVFRDKWILREVADRYLPGDLSQRTKAPFPTDAYHRLQISPTFFKNSLMVDLFGLSQQETRYLIDNSPLDLKLKLLQLDVWAHISLNNLAKQSIKDRLKDHVTIRPLD
jgi:asparagine synthase (glutamine-hydrolysing)